MCPKRPLLVILSFQLARNVFTLSNDNFNAQSDIFVHTPSRAVNSAGAPTRAGAGIPPGAKTSSPHAERGASGPSSVEHAGVYAAAIHLVHRGAQCRARLAKGRACLGG